MPNADGSSDVMRWSDSAFYCLNNSSSDMWSSTLPTGTVRNEKRSSRTYPQSTRQPPRPSESDRQSRTELEAEVDRLRQEKQQAEAEVQRLESEVDRLRSRLDDRQQSQQAVIDQYEAIITELEAAAATTPAANTTTSNRGLLSRLKRELF